jgi:hypothetical protein
MHPHRSLRERLDDLAAHGREPAFELTDDPTLVAFAALFDESGLAALDANKHLRTDAWSPTYDCWTESRQAPDSAVERFEATWTPVWGRTDPLTGFRTGWDSALLGSTPTAAMPQDERTAALLMLVTTRFVHLSASREGSDLLVRGAVDEGGAPDFDYLQLDPAVGSARRGTPPSPSDMSVRTTQPST